jgi:hypothetical protein
MVRTVIDDADLIADHGIESRKLNMAVEGYFPECACSSMIRIGTMASESRLDD